MAVCVIERVEQNVNSGYCDKALEAEVVEAGRRQESRAQNSFDASELDLVVCVVPLSCEKCLWGCHQELCQWLKENRW